MLGYQADQRDQSHLRIDVERREAEVQRQQCPEDRQRHRHQDDQRIAEAFELSGQHEVDHDDGEREGDDDGVAFLDLQPGLARIVDEEPVRQKRTRDLLELGEAVAGRDTDHRQCRDRGRVELVELLDRRRRHARRDLHDGRKRHHVARRAAHEEVAKALRVVAIFLRHLEDDVVAVGVALELRDRRSADQQAQRRADVANRQVQCGGTLAVDRDGHLLGIERQRVLHDDEPAGGLRLLLDLLGNLVDLARIARRLDHQRDRQTTASAGERRRCEDQRFHAGDARQTLLDVLLQFLLRPVALRPVLERPQCDARIGGAAKADDREVGVEFGNVLGQFAHLVGIGARIVRRRKRRRGDEREQGALVFFRRKLGRRVHEQEPGQRRQHQHHQQRHRPVFQRA